MAKKLILVVALLFLSCSPAWADSYSCWMGEEGGEEMIEDVVVPAEAMPDGSDEGTTTSAIEWDIMPMSSYTDYVDGMISSTYLDIAKGMVKHVPFTDNYVFARVGQYRYIFAYGDFSEGFSGSANVYTLTTAYSGNTYSWSHTFDSNFNLSVGNGLVYSDLSPYPTLSGSDYSLDIKFFCAFLVCLVFMLWIARLCFLSLF